MGGLVRQSYAAFAGSILIISYGMAYGWVSPIITELTDKEGDIRATKEELSWIVADIELGALTTPFVASYLMNKFGRKWPMLCTAPILMMSWSLTLLTRSVTVLYLKRLLDGMGAGLLLTIAPIYLAEIAEANIRGAILLSITISWYAGTLFQFCLGTYLSYNLSVWVNLVIPVFYCILFSFSPESPYYLVIKKQEDKAVKSLVWFRNAHPNQVADELKYIVEYLKKDAQNKESWTAVINNKVYRKCLCIMCCVILATIMTGVNTIFNYATEMFADTSEGFLNPDTCSVAIATLFFVINTASSFMIDKVGRRPLVIISAFGCCLSNLSSAIFFYFKDKIKYSWVPFLTIGSYCFFVSIGLTPVLVSFQGELFPSSIRELASGLIIVLTTLSSLVVLKLYYIIGSSLGIYINYLMYTVVAGVSTVWLYFHVPETKNKTFDELFQELEGRQGKVIDTQELQTLKGKH